MREVFTEYRATFEQAKKNISHAALAGGLSLALLTGCSGGDDQETHATPTPTSTEVVYIPTPKTTPDNCPIFW